MGAGPNLLVLVLADGSQAAMHRAITERAGEEPSVRVVAPAVLSPLAWLATDEDEARIEAEVRALNAEWTLADQAEVEGAAGDVDPVLAVEDALRRFSADEILVVGGAAEDEGLEASLRRFGLPVAWVDGAGGPRGRRRSREAVWAIVGGRSEATPFVAFAWANLALLALSALLTAVVVLVVWLH